jgi:hypothetical protein
MHPGRRHLGDARRPMNVATPGAILVPPPPQATAQRTESPQVSPARRVHLHGDVILLLACAPESASGRVADEPVAGVAMDGIPDASVASGDWTMESRAGHATLRSGSRILDLGEGVLPDVAFSADGSRFAWAAATDSPLADLWVMDLASGARSRVVDWPSAEHRPVFSPDSTRLDFFSGHTGLESLFVADLSTGEITQLTNLDLKKIHLGRPPEGFVPPPTAASPVWTTDRVEWESDSGRISILARGGSR